MNPPLISAVSAIRTHCQHCSLPIPPDVLQSGADFCCRGCEQVFAILNRAGLGEYYRIRAAVPGIRAPQAAPTAGSSYAWLDDPAFTTPTLNCDGSRTLEFYVEGVHCAACVWLLEKLPELLPDVRSVRLNLGSGIATVTLPAGGRFAPVAEAIERFGYKPFALKNQHEAEAHRERENRQMLMRIGVAAFSAGNLMILAVALYSGLEGALAHYFAWLALLLAVPALSYSAWPFYQGAWYRLRQRQLSIDVPIAFSLLTGLSAGIWQTFQQQGETYFDSLAMLVFLLLLSRYVLSRIQQRVAANSQLLSFYAHDQVEVWGEQGFVLQPVSRLQVGQRLRVQAGQRLPVDGEVVAGASALDVSLLTGESWPQPVSPGSRVYAGTRNQSAALEIRATAIGSDTKMAQILARTRQNLDSRSGLAALSDRLARRFVLIVLGAAALLFLWQGFNPQSFSRALSLIIISCPCALALATPLVMSISLRAAFARGYLIKNAQSLENLPALRTLIFDKTGTLTEGRFQVLQADPFSAEACAALCALEAQSTHPIAQALREHFASAQPLPAVSAFRTLASGGIEGQIAGCNWQVRPSTEAPALSAQQPVTCVELWREGQSMGRIWLGDRIRAGARESLDQLRAAGYTLVLLSGDQPAACATVATALGLDQVFAGVSPEAKEQILRRFPVPAMIGDGVNDILALSAAAIGISVQGGVEENLQTADIHLTEAGISQLPALLHHGRQTRRLVQLCLGFSLFYNLVSISAALLGWVTPLYAAVLMPVSSLTVVALAAAGGKKR
jgi:heavy metal translocating P-type ATPase